MQFRLPAKLALEFEKYYYRFTQHQPVTDAASLQIRLQAMGQAVTDAEVEALLAANNHCEGRLLTCSQFLGIVARLQRRFDRSRASDAAQAFASLGGNINGRVPAHALRKLVEGFRLKTPTAFSETHASEVDYETFLGTLESTTKPNMKASPSRQPSIETHRGRRFDRKRLLCSHLRFAGR